MDTLINVKELAGNITTPDWLVADCRFSLADAQAGELAYQQAHIEGAFYINLDKDLSTPHIPGKTGRHPLPVKADWISKVQALGISPQTQVVVYDDAGGAMASRMWWMLRWIGHEKVAVLDGGWKAWCQAGLPVSDIIPALPAASDTDYEALPSRVKIIQAEALDGETQILLDARELPRFRGDVEPLDPVAGHIPGALCSPFSANLDGDGFFRSAEALREKFSPVLAGDKPVVCYCGSGVTAAHNVLAMKIAGLEAPALYPGSWSEWITDSSRPIATGDED